MRLTVVGCSGSYPGPDSPASCYLVEHEGFRLVVDLGNGALGSLQRFAPLLEIDAVYVSHLHVDHFVDLASYYVARRYHPSGPAPVLEVHAPVGAAEQVAGAYGTPEALAHVRQVYAFQDLAVGMREVGPFRLTTVRAAHPVPAFAVRIEAGGVAMAYTGDTGPSAAVATLAEGANLLLSEASFVDGDANPPDLHLTGREAGELAAKAGVGTLVVTHVPPWHDADAAREDAASAFDGTVLRAVTGGVHEIGPA